MIGASVAGWGGGDGDREDAASASVPVPETSVPAPDETPVGSGIVSPIDPVRIVVPSVGVDAPIINLGLRTDGTLDVPATAHEAGWWSGGVRPGASGPAVIVGHVNLDGAEGVFGRLADLTEGDVVDVIGGYRNEVRYLITRIERHDKDAFPTDAVYGMTAGPELRLITCGGAFDSGSGHYEDNVIAFAVPAAQ